MARWPKLFLNGTAVYVSGRMEEGLPMVPLAFMNELIWSCLAMGAMLYDVKICCLTFEGNHFHFIFVVSDPEAISKFIGYVKQEISHRINRLLKQKKKTNWCKGFDSPTVLDVETVVEKFAYIFTNPVDDCLVEHVDQFKGVTSWHMFKDKQFSRKCRYTSRDSTPCLYDPKRPWLENKRLLKESEEDIPKELTIELEPYAWKKCFAETCNLSDDQIHETLLNAVRIMESDLREQHIKNKKAFAGFTALCHQSMVKRYTPTKFGKRMICLSKSIERRQQFIGEFKAMCALARKVYENWKGGDYSIPFPPGLFAPPPPRLCNIVPLPL